jgi:2-methylisocitrate lyase-like PEP mutase family enzyme
MTTFAELHKPGNPLFLPNAWDFASAAELVRAGYPVIGTTSLGVAAAAGKPDAAAATRDENLALTRLLARLPAMVSVDIEAGLSDDPRSVAALATELAAAGAVGVNIEDSRANGTLEPPELLCAKISAVKAAVPDLFVNARTDAFLLADHNNPPPTAEARQRAAAYLKSGADGIFIPGAADTDTIRTLSSSIDAPLNILYLPGRHTFRELAAAGAARVSTGSLLFRTALGAAVAAAHAARTNAVGADPSRPTYEQIQASLT